MLAYRVPQREIEVIVHLDRAEPLDGRLFVPAEGPSGAPQRLSVRLAEPGERFVALVREDGGHLIARDLILRVDLLAADEAVIEQEPGASAPRKASCRLVDGSVLEGTLSFSMPPGKQRLIDYVNSVEGFVPLHRGESVTLINQRHVVVWIGD